MFNPLFANDYYFPGVLLLISLGIILFNNEKLTKISITMVDVMVLFFAIYYIISVFLNSSLTRNIYDFYFLICYLFIYLALKTIFEHGEKNITFLIFFLITIFIFEGVSAIVQFLGLHQSKNSFFNITGSFISPALLTNFLCILFPLLYQYLIKYRFELLAKLLFAFLALICFLTDSKLSWLVLGILLFYKLAKNLKRTPIYVYVLCILSIYIIIHSIILQDSSTGRFLILRASINLWSENFINGIGVGNFDLIYNFYQGEFLLKQNNEVYNYLASYIEVAYNDFLQIAIEMGMFGVLFITSSLVLIFKNIKTYDDKTIEGIIVMAIIGFFSFPFQTSSTVALCCIYFASISSQHKPLLEINLRDRILKGLILLPSIWFMFLLFEIQNSLFIWKLSKQNIAILNQEKFVKTVEVLSNDKNFLVWYADILYLQKKHIQSIAILKRASTLSSKLDIFLLLALNYEAMGKMVASEQNYKKCILLVPSLIKPKFFLMKMYLQNKRLREAKKLALSIINTKLKINNNEADYMIKMSKKVIELN